MKSGRLEALSDGVIAIIITIMVLEFDAPDETSISGLLGLAPTFMAYVMSFIYVGIYWMNHHHLLAVTERVDAKVLWSNLHLLFWLSLIPFATAWVDDNVHAAFPVAFYGFVLLMCAFSYVILQRAIDKIQDSDFILRDAIRRDHKFKVVFIYAFGIMISFLSTWVAVVCYAIVALIWMIPDKKLEKVNEST